MKYPAGSRQAAKTGASKLTSKDNFDARLVEDAKSSEILRCAHSDLSRIAITHFFHLPFRRSRVTN
jgi:hypothetical protein